MSAAYKWLKLVLMYTSVPNVVIKMICRCQPVYIKYSIFGLPEHRSGGLQHEANLNWDDVNVIFAGIFIVHTHIQLPFSR